MGGVPFGRCIGRARNGSPQWETAGGNLPASQLYQTADIVLKDLGAEFDVSPFIRDGRIDGDELLTHAERRAPRGSVWVQFTDHGHFWKGAILYLGDEPVPARPTGRSEDSPAKAFVNAMSTNVTKQASMGRHALP